MRAITPVYANPFSIFNEFEKELTELVGRKDTALDRRFETREREDAWLMAFDLPGVKTEDLDIEFEDGVLNIEGKRQNLFGEGEGAKFTKAVRVPETVDVEKIHAKLENGVLMLTLPKMEKEKPKKIAINAH